MRDAWANFRELLPLLSCRTLILASRVHNCVRSTMMYRSECWPLKQTNISRLQRNEHSMLREMCHIKRNYNIHLGALCKKLTLINLEAAICCRRMKWFGHVNRSTGWINRIFSLPVDGRIKRGRPNKIWAESVKAEDALNIVQWRATMQHLIQK